MTLRSSLRAEIVLRERMAAAIPLPAAAHEILLHVALAHVEGRRVNVKGAAGHLPIATALRVIGLLVDAGLLRREPSDGDRRKTWLTITDEGFARVAALFDEPQARAA